jgi:hypothetical protein
MAVVGALRVDGIDRWKWLQHVPSVASWAWHHARKYQQGKAQQGNVTLWQLARYGAHLICSSRAAAACDATFDSLSAPSLAAARAACKRTVAQNTQIKEDATNKFCMASEKQIQASQQRNTNIKQRHSIAKICHSTGHTAQHSTAQAFITRLLFCKGRLQSCNAALQLLLGSLRLEYACM